MPFSQGRVIFCSSGMSAGRILSFQPGGCGRAIGGSISTDVQHEQPTEVVS